MREPTVSPEHESPEDEGIPDIGVPHPAKRATGDPQEGLIVPGDEPRAAESIGVTAEEQREGASLDARLAEEELDVEPGRRHDAGRLIEDGDGSIDTEKDLVADAAEDELEGRSAEEAAVRVDDEAVGGTDGPDTYVEDDPDVENDPDRSG